MSPFAPERRDADGKRRFKATLGVTLERVSGVPPRGLEMCLAQADSTPMPRSQESRRSTGSTR